MLSFFIGFFLFIIGSAIGSHVNVLIDRIPRDESVWCGRSYCEKCKKKLVWYELIPVLSYLVLGGKCRTCHAKIPKRILLVELLTGSLFVIFYFVPLYGMPPLPYLLFIFLIIPLLIAIFFIDFDHMIIPDSLLAILICVVLIMQFLTARGRLEELILSGLAASLFFFILFAATRGRGMGFGDVKFVFLIGLLFGVRGTIISLYVAFLTGAAIGAILIVAKKKKLRGGIIPFGPFLILGIFITLLFGNMITQMVPLLK